MKIEIKIEKYFKVLNNFTLYGKNTNKYLLGVNMQKSNVNNVIFLKNVESNIIDEAFLILKDNVNANNITDNIKEINNVKKIDILKEAEELVNQKLKQSDIKYEKFKIKKLEKKIKILKALNIIFVVTIIISIILKF